MKINLLKKIKNSPKNRSKIDLQKDNKLHTQINIFLK